MRKRSKRGRAHCSRRAEAHSNKPMGISDSVYMDYSTPMLTGCFFASAARLFERGIALTHLL